jgi:hypothetical protein
MRSLSLIFAAAVIGLAPSMAPSIARADQGSQCAVCRYALEKSEKKMSELKSDGRLDDANVQKALLAACATAQGITRDQCEGVVNSSSKAMANSLRKGFNQKQVCQEIGLCQKL